MQKTVLVESLSAYFIKRLLSKYGHLLQALEHVQIL